MYYKPLIFLKSSDMYKKQLNQRNKMKKIYILLPLSFITLALIMNLFFETLFSHYKKDVEMLSISSGNIDCLLFGGSALQRMSCLRNFDHIKSKSPDSDLNAILETLCSTGNATGCIIKGQLSAINQRVGLNATTPFNLSWLYDNCVNSHKQSISTPDRLTSCALLRGYAEIVNAKLTIDFIDQQQCILNPEKCLTAFSSNYLFTLEQNNNLYEQNCGYKWKIEKLNTYCAKLDNFINFQLSFMQLLTSNRDYKIDYTKKFDQLCIGNEETCLKIVNQPVFLNALITLDKKFNVQYFDKFYIHTTAGLFLDEKLNLGKASSLPNNKIFKFLNNYHNNKQNLNLKDCNETEDKSFCFLAVKTLKEAKLNLYSLKKFCEKGDGISCAYETIIKNAKTLNLDEKKEILFYFQDYESFVIDYLQLKNNSVKYLTFLNQNRFWIFSFLLTTNLFFILYFINVFSKIGSVYTYLKNEKIKELKEKIKNNK